MSTTSEQILTLEDVLSAFKDKRSKEDVALIKRAYEVAKEVHKDTMRISGVPYIQHPLHTALTLAQMQLDTDTIVAAFLHDVIEESSDKLNKAAIEAEFGKDVAFLVEGVSNIAKLRFIENQRRIENLRKLFLSMAKDVRVILIKLADRLHNMRTLYSRHSPAQKRIALQTLEVYAPLAHRLGIGEIKGELEDLSFKYLQPEDYKWIVQNVKQAFDDRKEYIEDFMPKVRQKLERSDVEIVDIHGRAKHVYSLYRKLKRVHMDINQVYDLVALRVIVPDEIACYRALGIIHSNWKPLVGKIKDYIATPKVNGYQSIHTTVIGDDETITEIQIRTAKMHENAEYGIAAHWFYKDTLSKDEKKKGALKDAQKDLSWMKQLSQWQADLKNPEDFMRSLRIDFFKDRIFTYTPQGDIIDLPFESTPIDFAFGIHTDIGRHTTAVKVNNQVVAPDHTLQNGDVVEIVSNPKTEPQREWLESVKTNLARREIRKYFQMRSGKDSETEGMAIINNVLEKLFSTTFNQLKERRISVALNKLDISNQSILLRLLGKGEIEIEKIINALYEPTEIFRTRQDFITKTQDRLGTLLRKPRIKDVEKLENHLAEIKLQTTKQTGLLHKITSTLAENEINIYSVSAAEHDYDEAADIFITIEVTDIKNLLAIINKLRRLPNILDVRLQTKS